MRVTLSGTVIAGVLAAVTFADGATTAQITQQPSPTNVRADAVTVEIAPLADGVTLECALDDSSNAAFASCPPLSDAGDGNQKFDYPTTAGDGAHTLYLRARQSDGTVQSPPAEANFVIDKTPPVFSFTGTITGPNGTDSAPIAKANSVPVNGAINVTVSTDEMVSAFRCGLNIPDNMSCVIGRPISIPYSALGPGLNTLQVSAVDSAGNAATASITFTKTLDPSSISLSDSPHGNTGAHRLICAKVTTIDGKANALYSVFGKQLETRDNPPKPLQVDNMKYSHAQLQDTDCANGSHFSGIIIQGLEKIDTGGKTLFYHWAKENTHTYQLSRVPFLQSGHVDGVNVRSANDSKSLNVLPKPSDNSDEGSWPIKAARGCRTREPRYGDPPADVVPVAHPAFTARICNGDPYPDMIVGGKPVAWEIDPKHATVPLEMGYKVHNPNYKGLPKGWASYRNYGTPSASDDSSDKNFSDDHTPLQWSLPTNSPAGGKPLVGGGIVRAQLSATAFKDVPKTECIGAPPVDICTAADAGTLFYQAAVQPVQTVTYASAPGTRACIRKLTKARGERKAKLLCRRASNVTNGWIRFIYGYVLLPKNGSCDVTAADCVSERVYGWVMQSFRYDGSTADGSGLSPAGARVEDVLSPYAGPWGAQIIPSDYMARSSGPPIRSAVATSSDMEQFRVGPADFGGSGWATRSEVDGSPSETATTDVGPDGPVVTACETCDVWGTSNADNSDERFLTDVNGDGRADSVAYYSSGVWFVGLSGSRGFGEDDEWATNFGIDADQVFAADVTGDGRADAIAYSSDAGVWIVAPSNGHGFGAPEPWTTGFGVGADKVMLADVTGDGTADAIAYSSDSGTWTVAPSNGSRFLSGRRFASGLGAAADNSLVADVNGDGKADAVSYTSETGDWMVGLSNGFGFSSGQTWASGFEPDATATKLADVNGDGKADALAYTDGTGYWEIATSSGSGLNAPEPWLDGFGAGADEVFLADVNGDGRSDAAAFYTDNGSWTVATAGDRAFSAYGMWKYDFGGDSTQRLFADVNGDGKADAVTYSSADHSWHVATAENGTFGDATTWIDGFGAGSTDRLLADLNGDGKADAIAIDRNDGSWRVALSTGNGFDSSATVAGDFAGASSSVFVMDVTGDGKADAVTVDQSTGTWRVWASDSGGFAGSPTVWASGFADAGSTPMLADVTGDGKADAVAFDPASGDWRVEASDGGSFGEARTWRNDFGRGSSGQWLADIDGDGKADAITYSSSDPDWSASWMAALSNGDGFAEPVDIMDGAGSGAATRDFADVNGDGRSDANFFYAKEQQWFVNPNINIDSPSTPEHSGLAGFHDPATWATGVMTAAAQLVGDVNGDGKSDSVIVEQGTGDWYVALSTGSLAGGGFGATSAFTLWRHALGSAANRYLLADVNGDGKDDAIAINVDSSDYKATWWTAASNGDSFDDGPTTGTPWLVYYTSGYAVNAMAADVNGDHKADAAMFVAGDGGHWFVGISDGVRFSGGLDDQGVQRDAGNEWWSSAGDTVDHSLLADVDGDGKADAIVKLESGDWLVARSTGSSFAPDPDPWSTGFGATATKLMTGDVNGDGLADVVAFYGNTGAWGVETSDGASFTPAVTDGGPQNSNVWIGDFGTGSTSQMVGDVTGDGLADAIAYFGGTDAWHVAPAFDLNPPLTSIVGGPRDGESVNSHDITFSMASEAGVHYQCDVDHGGYVSCSSPYDVSLGDGVHNFAVRAVDHSGNADPSPATVTFTVDTVAPDTAITAGPSEGDVVTDSAVAFTFRSSSASSFRCSLDGEPPHRCNSPSVTDAVGDGGHTFSVAAVDDAGNVDLSPATVDFSVATGATPPDTTIGEHPANPRNVADDATFTFDADQSGGRFECSIDDEPWSECMSPDVFAVPPVKDKTFTFRVRAVNSFGIPDPTPASYAWRIDAEPPVVTALSPWDGEWLDASPVEAYFEIDDPSASVTCALDGGIPLPCASGDAFDVGTSGMHSLVIAAIDEAGNVGTAPIRLSVLAGLDTEFTQTPARTTSDTTPEFDFQSSEPAATFECSADNGAWTDCGPPHVVDLAGMPDGPHDLKVRSVLNGVRDATPADYSYTIDSLPPDTSITAAPNPIGRDATPRFDFTSSDAGSTFECSNERVGAADEYSSCDPPLMIDTPLSDGDYIFKVRATDQAGNTDPVSASVAFRVDGGYLGFTDALQIDTTSTVAGAHPDLTLTSYLAGFPDVKSLTFSLPPGLILGPAAVAAPCSLADADDGGCGPQAQIGTVDAKRLDGAYATGNLYLTDAPTSGAMAGIAMKMVLDNGDSLVAHGTMALGNAGVIQPRQTISFPNFPRKTTSGDDLHFVRLSLSLTGSTGEPDHPLLTNPSTCPSVAPTISSSVGAYDASNASSSRSYPTTGCSSLNFAPSFDDSFSNLTAGADTGADFIIDLPSGQSSVKRIGIKMPPFVWLDSMGFGSARDMCPSGALSVSTAVAFNPAPCPAQALIGTVALTSPLLPTPLTGSLYVVNKSPLPAFGIALQQAGVLISLGAFESYPQVDISCSAEIDGYCATQMMISVATLPDIPLTQFRMSIGRSGRVNQDGVPLPESVLRFAPPNADECVSPGELRATIVPWNSTVAAAVTEQVAIGGCDG